MPYTFVNRPKVWDPIVIEKWIATMISNQADLLARLEASAIYGIINGSFENDGDGDDIPDGWTLYAVSSGGSGELDTDAIHGGKSMKFTVPGAGLSGGYIEHSALIPIKPSTEYSVIFYTKSTDPEIKNSVSADWYNSSSQYISSSVMWEDDEFNPSDWEARIGTAESPATAKFMKLIIEGGASDSPAGTVHFDNISFLEPSFFGIQEIYTTPDTHVWTCPFNVTGVYSILIGPGGGGGGGRDGLPGSLGRANGGGGGAYIETFIPTIPGRSYDLVIPSGGAGGAKSAAGSTSNPTSFQYGGSVLASAAAGVGGGTYNGGPGAGGVAATTDEIIGASGDPGVGGTAPDGGKANCAPFPSTGGTYPEGEGEDFGAGGSGGDGNAVGNAGSPGMILLRY